MAERRRIIRGLLALGAALLLAFTVAACGKSSTASSPSPRPAVSVSALPGFSDADQKQDLPAYRAVEARVVEVFIKEHTPAADKSAMAQEIAAMPEVAAYHFVSKSEALQRFAARFGERIVANLPVNPLPASFDILVRERKDVIAVAQRFFKDPRVDNDPGTHDGVKYVRDENLQAVLSPSPSPSR